MTGAGVVLFTIVTITKHSAINSAEIQRVGLRFHTSETSRM